MIAAALIVLVVAMTAPALAADAAPAGPANSRAELKALAARIAVEEGISPSLFDALITAESNYRVDAVSPKGAMSLAQLMPATAAELGIAAADHFNPEINLRGGARYLKAQIDAAGDVAIALGAYNAGMKRVKDRPFEHWPRETRAYVTAILKRLEMAAAPRRFIGSIVSMPKPAVPGETQDPDTPAMPDAPYTPDKSYVPYMPARPARTASPPLSGAGAEPLAPGVVDGFGISPALGGVESVAAEPPDAGDGLDISFDGMIDLATGVTS